MTVLLTNGVPRVLNYVRWMLPGVLLALAAYLLLRPLRRRHLRARRRVSSGRRELALLVLFLYAGGIAALTLFPEPGWLWTGLHGYWTPLIDGSQMPLAHRTNLIPFSHGDSLFNLIGNIVMFLPFGFLGSLLWQGWNWKRGLCVGLLIALGIECWQLCIGRFFDMDDVILNALGVFCGGLLRKPLEKRAPKFVQTLHKRIW